MKKIFAFLVLTLVFSSVTFAQAFDEPKPKPTVYIDYFKRTSDVPFSLAEGLRNGVIGGIQKMNRVILIDVDSQDVLRIEESRRNSEGISAGDDNEMDRLAVMGQLGAQFLITGHVASITTSWVDGKDGKPGYYSAKASLTVKVINPNNGTLIGTESFTASGTAKERQAAMAAACSATFDMDDFVDNYFKIEGSIIEVNKSKKDKAEEVYINVGSAHGVISNQKFTVYIAREVAGRVARKEVGRLNVKSVEGDDISLCKVNKGGEEILKAFNEENKIIVVSRKQTLLGGLGNIVRENE
ncbi:hypothetical protein [Bacteroides sp. 519]|uniref:hypothetical protein n=1 Tax=Bacteroides sp. 519 TaxID=2302937 RepID=UPI0013D6FCB0|nr:hypothetical protein [Bacteroides sp. 519]NDV58101.1 hypothetical protein [Bacteroides sp. 519]